MIEKVPGSLRKNYSRILLVGLSGSGRQFILSKIDRMTKIDNLICRSYSQMLLEELKKMISSRLSVDDLRNIEYRVMSKAKESLNKRLSRINSWILSTMICYKQDKNYLFSVDTIRELEPDFIIHVSSTPSEIVFRRKNNKERLYEEETEEEVSIHQSISEFISKTTADLVGCDYMIIRNLRDNIDDNIKVIQRIIGDCNEF